jgi:hypothetical protein
MLQTAAISDTLPSAFGGHARDARRDLARSIYTLSSIKRWARPKLVVHGKPFSFSRRWQAMPLRSSVRASLLAAVDPDLDLKPDQACIRMCMKPNTG